MQQPKGSAAYTGWFRPKRWAPWRAIAQGATEAETLHKLLTAVGSGDCLVLPAGQSPDPPSAPPAIKRGAPS